MISMDINGKQIIEALFQILNHFVDRDYQEKAWIRGEAADFDESVCLFFDISDPIIKNYEQFEITKNQYRILMHFHNEFRTFSKENDWPSEFLDTPKWSKIISMAKEVLEAFHYPA